MPAHWTIDQRELRYWGHEHQWFTNRDIAIGLGVAPSTLSRVVSGKSEPGQALLARMRLAFGDEAFAKITTVVEVEGDLDGELDVDEVTNGAPA